MMKKRISREVVEIEIYKRYILEKKNGTKLSKADHHKITRF